MEGSPPFILSFCVFFYFGNSVRIVVNCSKVNTNDFIICRDKTNGHSSGQKLLYETLSFGGKLSDGERTFSSLVWFRVSRHYWCIGMHLGINFPLTASSKLTRTSTNDCPLVGLFMGKCTAQHYTETLMLPSHLQMFDKAKPCAFY